MARKPYVEQSFCTGCELCEQVCPEVFRMNDEGSLKCITRMEPLKKKSRTP